MSSGALSYLGPQWRRDIAFAGNNVPMQVCAQLVCCRWCVQLVYCQMAGALACAAVAGEQGLTPTAAPAGGLACLQSQPPRRDAASAPPPHCSPAPICLQGDIAAGKMIYGVEGVDPERRER